QQEKSTSIQESRNISRYIRNKTHMGSIDMTILVYRSAEVDDIENFFFDYEGYAKAKKYNEETICFRKIISKVKADNESELKIVWLKHLKQGNKESVREYTNRTDEKHDWFIQGLKEPYYSKVENYYPKDYEKVKKKALGIEEYKRKRDHRYEDQPTSEDTPYFNKPDADIDSLVTKLAALKINCMDQEGQLKCD
ncbi:3486_t:CDS:2, partial [Racocetra persica]